MSLPSIAPVSVAVMQPPTQVPAPVPSAATSTDTRAAIEPTAQASRSADATTGQGTDANEAVPATAAELQEALDQFKTAISVVANELTFSIDEDSGRTLVKIIDRETDEVIKQIPSEEMLQIAKALDKLQGLLVKQDA